MTTEKADLSRMLETAIVAARLGGQRAIEQIGYVKAEVKAPDELVTTADTASQQAIIERIKQNYPDHGFIAEEGGQGRILKQPPRGTERFWWIIDPLDGTTNFAHGLPLFCTSIAVMHEGQVLVGVVFDPATDSMFTAVQTGQAQLNGRTIKASDNPINKLHCIGLDSHYDQGVPQWICWIMQRSRFRNLGSTALQFAYVAAGSLIATIANKPKLWDIAAGTLIAETAGAIVTDWQGNKLFPFDLDKYQGEELKVLAANKKVHKELLELMAST